MAGPGPAGGGHPWLSLHPREADPDVPATLAARRGPERAGRIPRPTPPAQSTAATGRKRRRAGCRLSTPEPHHGGWGQALRVVEGEGEARSAPLLGGVPLGLQTHIGHTRFPIGAAQPVVAADAIAPAHSRTHAGRSFSGGTTAATVQARTTTGGLATGQCQQPQQEQRGPRCRQRQGRRISGSGRPARPLRAPHSPAGRWAPRPATAAGRRAAG